MVRQTTRHADRQKPPSFEVLLYTHEDRPPSPLNTPNVNGEPFKKRAGLTVDTRTCMNISATWNDYESASHLKRPQRIDFRFFIDVPPLDDKTSSAHPKSAARKVPRYAERVSERAEPIAKAHKLAYTLVENTLNTLAERADVKRLRLPLGDKERTWDEVDLNKSNSEGKVAVLCSIFPNERPLNSNLSTKSRDEAEKFDFSAFAEAAKEALESALIENCRQFREVSAARDSLRAPNPKGR